MLELTKISKSYKNQIVLDTISLVVPAATKLCIMGLNGKGKTTLLKIILGLIKPDSGEVVRQGSIFYLPEKFTPSGNISAREFITTSLAHYGQVGYSIEFGLTAELLQKKFSQLSKGTVQKVLFTVAKASKADIYIFDEPMSGLDIKVRSEVKSFIKALNATVIFTSHNKEDVEDVAGELAILKDGMLFIGGDISLLLD
jgi:ABC-2 type transport system ATP-binding protein